MNEGNIPNENNIPNESNKKGIVIKYGDNVDTDVIIPARYLNSTNPAELASHCMEDIDSSFTGRVRHGDFIAAGYNFGCGSSREHAPIAIKASGIACVIAKSFARIFYRNAINIGLPIIETDADFSEGDTLTIDFEAGVIHNLTQNTREAFSPFPKFLQNIIEAGGLLESLSKTADSAGNKTDHTAGEEKIPNGEKIPGVQK